MSTLATHPLENLADLLRSLGGVSPDRVLMKPAPGTAVESDLARAPRRQGKILELASGVLVEKEMGFPQSWLALTLARAILEFLDRNPIGILGGPDGPIRLGPGLVRVPDLCFISRDRLPGRAVPDQRILDVVPDLAVEILSDGNTTGEMERKLIEYFGAGVRLVWIIDPAKRSAWAYRSPERSTLIGEADSLDGEDVLPGFRIGLGEWLDRGARW